MLAVNGLGFRHKGREILKDISFSINRGEIVSVIGPNGAGKSTLLRCILRIFIATEGSVTIDGEDAFLMGVTRRSQRLSYMPQEGHFPRPHMTVFDVVIMGRRSYSTAWQPTEEDVDKTIAVLDAFNMDPNRDFNELSGCERQRVLFARVLVQEADYMLLDEPASNLDLRRQFEVMESLMAAASQRQIGILIVLHDLNLAYRFSDQVVMLHNGRLVSKGPPGSVMSKENMNLVYGVETEEVDCSGFRHLVSIGPAADGKTLH
ncbi:ABC transporter ATP-binding protein [Dissulfurimicrobium hydrothermale]|uniref:ABC transporter ATP-binding protein n=1 Tax=Dissulfurimicrobium hydrothermale TaxID=1750598 RepID=UPI001EDBE62E|nr:ABC transporter ATP-binding protein [Dissulfurimicrobium hydrothermale]UKL13402.1 ABC transporter ATP-binding protein [Dissulfurimicrobium hydrothermale]